MGFSTYTGTVTAADEWGGPAQRKRVRPALPDSVEDARPADQFDVLIHVDETRALEPLERTQRWEAGELAETYPFGV